MIKENYGKAEEASGRRDNIDSEKSTSLDASQSLIGQWNGCVPRVSFSGCGVPASREHTPFQLITQKAIAPLL